MMAVNAKSFIGDMIQFRLTYNVGWEQEDDDVKQFWYVIAALFIVRDNVSVGVSTALLWY